MEQKLDGQDARWRRSLMDIKEEEVANEKEEFLSTHHLGGEGSHSPMKRFVKSPGTAS